MTVAPATPNASNARNIGEELLRENLQGAALMATEEIRPEEAAPEAEEGQQAAPENGSAPEATATAEPAAPAAETATPDDEAGDDATPAADKDHLKWYVVHTYSGFENRAQKALAERVKQHKLDDKFGDILVPTETVEQVKGGARRTQKRKFFPGYMLVQMELTDETWHLVKNTPKVTGFVGGSTATNPPPIKEAEVQRLIGQITEGVAKPTPKIEFSEGDQIRVIEGPFANFNGSVEEVKPDKQKVRVLVSIFGRSTPVELDFMQVEKVG
jgi:transcriptional antiterminator NusG